MHDAALPEYKISSHTYSNIQPGKLSVLTCTFIRLTNHQQTLPKPIVALATYSMIKRTLILVALGQNEEALLTFLRLTKNYKTLPEPTVALWQDTHKSKRTLI